jgi:hypothetical protein
MKKKTYGCVTQPVSQHCRKEHQMVIVNPDPITRLILLDHGIAEPTICFDVGVPSLRVEMEPRGEAMEQRPESPVGIALVKLRRDIGREIHGDARLLA